MRRAARDRESHCVIHHFRARPRRRAPTCGRDTVVVAGAVEQARRVRVVDESGALVQHIVAHDAHARLERDAVVIRRRRCQHAAERGDRGRDGRIALPLDALRPRGVAHVERSAVRRRSRTRARSRRAARRRPRPRVPGSSAHPEASARARGRDPRPAASDRRSRGRAARSRRRPPRGGRSAAASRGSAAPAGCSSRRCASGSAGSCRG